MRKLTNGFTLAELLFSMAIIVLLVLLVSRLIASAAAVTTQGHKRMDADSQARQIFDRMAIDFAQMIKRSDVDSYIKGLDTEAGNDKIAFFCEAPGYYPASGSQSSISLVSYRINATNKMERMGKGLLWNGASTTDKPLIFGPTPTLQTNWPSAVNGSADPDYEIIGPQIFRFEYYYLLKNGALAISPGPSGIQDVAAISVCIAIVDPKSKILLSNSQLTALADPNRLKDFSTSMARGDLLSQWQSALDSTTDMPRPAISGIRLYERDFYTK
jgi:prepilin-type N-terminal cleavage/methylation domain-containing protein